MKGVSCEKNIYHQRRAYDSSHHRVPLLNLFVNFIV